MYRHFRHDDKTCVQSSNSCWHFQGSTTIWLFYTSLLFIANVILIKSSFYIIFEFNFFTVLIFPLAFIKTLRDKNYVDIKVVHCNYFFQRGLFGTYVIFGVPATRCCDPSLMLYDFSLFVFLCTVIQ